jgi:hypothetical protein
MVPQHVAMGLAIVLVSLFLLINQQRLLVHSRYGRLLRHWFGEERSPHVLRVLLALTAIFGVLLAIEVVRPLNLLPW